nr:MAG TPA: Type II secretion system, protein M [Caudoviricetes sp.]
MTNNVKLVCANIAFVFLVLFVVCVNLGSRVRTLETSNSDLQQTIRTQNDELVKAKEKNTMQDVIINKLNTDYNSRMAQELQEIADMNGVGG